MSQLRVCFAGTPEFAAAHLRALIAAQQGGGTQAPFEVVAVYTQPDRPAGRGKKLSPSPVKQVALEAELPVLQPVSLRSEEAQSELASLECDVRLLAADLLAGLGTAVSGALYIFVAIAYFRLPSHASLALLFYFLAGFLCMPL